MTFKNLSVKRLFGWIVAGLFLSMSVITLSLFFITKQTAVLLTGGVLLLCALIWLFLLTQIFGKRLSAFTSVLCQTLDHMIEGNEAPLRPEDSETMLARICYRLSRLYQIMQENRRKVDEERRELQSLISDISHQVKTPVSNLKMAADTLLEKPVSEAERIDFIRGIFSQTDKLDFLFQVLVKTSRLETGVIQLEKKPGRLFDTVAQAMSGILVDEAHLLTLEKLEILLELSEHQPVIFSSDSEDMISPDEMDRSVMERIGNLPQIQSFHLTNRIRTNAELSSFIQNILHLPDKKGTRNYPHVDVVYANEKKETENLLKDYIRQGYEYQKNKGQIKENKETEQLVMVLDDAYYYDEKGYLRTNVCKEEGKQEVRSLFHQLNQAKERLTLIIEKNEEVYEKMLNLL